MHAYIKWYIYVDQNWYAVAYEQKKVVWQMPHQPYRFCRPWRTSVQFCLHIYKIIGSNWIIFTGTALVVDGEKVAYIEHLKQSIGSVLESLIMHETRQRVRERWDTCLKS
jgi:hypothetical protein